MGADEQPSKLFAVIIIAKAGICDDGRNIYTEEALREYAETNPKLWYEETDQTLRECLELKFGLEPVPHWSFDKWHSGAPPPGFMILQPNTEVEFVDSGEEIE